MAWWSRGEDKGLALNKKPTPKKKTFEKKKLVRTKRIRLTTDTRLVHMRPGTVAALKLRTSSSMYLSSSPRRCRKSANRLIGILESVKSEEKTMPNFAASSSRYLASSALWSGGKKAPRGL